MTDWRHTTTDRLWLDQPHPDDVDDLHRIHGDPINWAHFPQGRHRDAARTMESVERSVTEWASGLGYWCARISAGGPVIGMAGCAIPGAVPWWNLYYRFDSSVHGHGYAAEAARAAIVAARDVDPARPVLAWAPTSGSIER